MPANRFSSETGREAALRKAALTRQRTAESLLGVSKAEAYRKGYHHGWYAARYYYVTRRQRKAIRDSPC
jgi:hypothetical protein